MKQFLQQLWHAPRRLTIALVRAYQATLSPDHGPLKHLYPYGYCRHEPTCSQYAIIQLEKRGLIIGGLLSAARLLTCHPWRKLDEKKVRKILQIDK